jgi:hypothetical protein
MTEIPMSDKTREILLRARAKFIEKFGREPGPDDPVSFDPSADTPQPVNIEVVEQHLLEALHRTDTPGWIAHAFQKTGLLLSEEAFWKISARDRAAYVAAVDEWIREHPDEPGPSPWPPRQPRQRRRK